MTNQKSQYSESEEQVLSFWQKNDIFQKTLSKKSPKGEFVFYDGPPFATGMPHYGHILAGTMKDAVPRYKTMCGYHVDRKWGWDCHGLPIEKLVQEENNLSSKKDIEDFGIKNFSKAAKASVFRYAKEWKQIIPRTGRFVDMENGYTTMDPEFMESVWWAFSELHKKGLVYEDFKTMHISPPLETPLSNFEVNLNYKDITDISAYVKFKLINSPNTFLIAWTTTPWTLFGNVALAVGPEIEYVKVKENVTSTITSDKKYVSPSGDIYIVAKEIFYKNAVKNYPDSNLDRFEYKGKILDVIEIIKGSDLIGKSYEPVFDHYYKKTELQNKQNGWKVYGADFVTTEDGSGIVHIAPAFGEDDLKLGQKEKLPFVQHVTIDGKIRPEITELAGRQAKPKSTNEKPNAHQETDIEVIKMLAHQGSLFEKEKFTHSYPHCWRTDAPLLNYALSSWFVRVTNYNKKMMELNKKVRWVPSAIGEKRFGNWLENVKDWGVSRSRYWGTSMPVWKSKDGTEIDVIGSVGQLRAKTKSTNNYILMRHGEAEHNVKKVLNCDNSVPANLTENGQRDVLESAKKILSEHKKIDLIFTSPLVRAKQTAEIAAKYFNLSEKEIIVDARIKESQGGIFNHKTIDEYDKFFTSDLEYFEKRAPEGENIVDIKIRVGEFIYEIDKKYEGKNILIISHDWPLWMLESLSRGFDNKKSLEIVKNSFVFLQPGQFKKLDFAPIPHDDEYVLDLHRPYIDEVTYIKNGKEMKRIPDVFDTWFDSGSMPFAVPHYPFEQKMDPAMGIFGFLKKTKKFPADFIAEGLDQTRGWFYTLLALNTALFGKSPYKNVIVNGLVLAEDGQKMSKRLKNYPDPELIFNKYGADSMRYYMLSSGIVSAESLQFSEKGVDEIYKKIISRLLNVVSFYELYVSPEERKKMSEQKLSTFSTSQNILDKWIMARTNQVLTETTDSLEKYELNSACRPFFDFVDDLSTWYLRRSRDRFKGDDTKEKNLATNTTFYVLNQFSKIIAPFMPFLSEIVYQRVNGFNFSNTNQSVHLESWPSISVYDQKLSDQMKSVRKFVSLALLARDRAGLKVRQPLKTLKIKTTQNFFSNDLLDLIKDEVNIKEVICDEFLSEEVWIDTKIDADLRNEGIIRELNRFIQTLRKDKSLATTDKIILSISTNEEGQKIIESFKVQISESVRATEIKISDSLTENTAEIEIEQILFKVSI